MNKPTTEQFETAIEVLRWLKTNLQDYDGWGMDENCINSTKTWLENINNGYYSK